MQGETKQQTAREIAEAILNRVCETNGHLHEALEKLRGPAKESAPESPPPYGDDLLSTLGRIHDLATVASLRSGELNRALGDVVPAEWGCEAIPDHCTQSKPVKKTPGTRRR